MPLYTRAKRRFFQLMQVQGFPRKYVEPYFENRDVQNVAVLGFTRRRFGTSMMQTYRHFCRANNQPTKDSVKHAIDLIHNHIFIRPAKLQPFARSVLRSLKKRYRLLLLTKGTRTVQLRRISGSNLSHFFEKILVVRHKDKDTFEEILKALNAEPGNVWSIGDSITSDINPAVQSGLNAIWIPQPTWRYEQGVPLRSKRVYKIKSLKQVSRVLNSRSES
jgi:putative hydrolase of the HAD superfamily